MKNFLVLMLLCFFMSVSGQINRYGVPVIRNYQTQTTGGSEQNWCITRDKSGNLYFGNQDRGVVRYDGTKWTTITIGKNPRIYSLAADTTGIVYVGAAFEFGYIQPDLKGKPEYISLASRIDSLPEIKIIQSILIRDRDVLFLSSGYIYDYNITSDSLSRISLKQFNVKTALRMVSNDKRIIIADYNEGLFELKGETISRLPGGEFFKKKDCTVLLPFDQQKLLIGTFFHGLHLYDYEKGVIDSSFVDKKIFNRLKDVMVYAGARLGNDLFAIGTTQEEGILIFNKSGELIQKIDNKNSEIGDITIYSMFCDYQNQSELWITSEGFISKAYINLPITYFSGRQGIETVINGICKFNGDLYLSSDAGVLRSHITTGNTVEFESVPNAGIQAFPLIVAKLPSRELLLAGSLNGILEISKNSVRSLPAEAVLGKIHEGQSDRYYARKILQSEADPSVVYVGLQGKGVSIMRNDAKGWHHVNWIGRNIPGTINGMIEKEEGGLWFITDDPNALYSASFQDKDTLISKFGPENGITNIDINSINSIGNEVYITTSSGIMRYDKSSGKFVEDNTLTGNYSRGRNSLNIFGDEAGDIWFSGIDKDIYERLFTKNGTGYSLYSGILNLLPDGQLMDIMNSDNKIYLLKSRFLYVIDKSALKADSTKVKPSFVRITAGADSVIINGTFYKTDKIGRRIPVAASIPSELPEFSYDMNEVSFEWTTAYYTEELLTEYSYMLEGYDTKWSAWEGISYGNTMEAQYFKRDYKNLPYGSYNFRVRTKTLTGLTGDELNYQFIILKPWYATIIAIIGFIFAGIFIIYIIIVAYTQKLKNENLRLEGIVAERTAVVVKQKDELESSIHYASRIQMALLPSETVLAENIKNYFVLFRPRDIVSGDFYWMTKKNDRLYIVGADCTGHGVPGAFMSLLGMSFLDEIIDKDHAYRADEILRELRKHVIESLKQVGNDDETKDGMDIALLVIDFATQRIEFSGAYNPCFRVRKIKEEELGKFGSDFSEDGSISNGKYLLETIYASKMPIGISSRLHDDFVFHDWALEKGITYYLFSDGYVDQFGGPDGRKFMKKNFKNLILSIQDYPMQKQKEILENNLKEWMGETPQIDDILVMGVRI